jgi:hypothetical protein
MRINLGNVHFDVLICVPAASLCEATVTAWTANIFHQLLNAQIYNNANTRYPDIMRLSESKCSLAIHLIIAWPIGYVP